MTCRRNVTAECRIYAWQAAAQPASLAPEREILRLPPGQPSDLQPSADNVTIPAQPICSCLCTDVLLYVRSSAIAYTPPLHQPRLAAPCLLQPPQSLASPPTGPASASHCMMLTAAQGKRKRQSNRCMLWPSRYCIIAAAPGRYPIRGELVPQGQRLPGHSPSMAPDLLVETCRWCRCCVPSAGCCDPLGSHTHSRPPLCSEAALYKPYASQH